MTPSTIALLSWIPFLLVALICGLAFSFRGYKRGAARAGISIGVTILSSFLSILVAKLLSGTLASVLRPMVSDMLSDLGDSEAISRLADGVTQALCATVLYLPVFLILAIVLKVVASVIFKRILPKPEKTLNRVGGLAISIGDALVFAFLLLIPLYGTLALGGNVVTMMNAAEGEDLPEEMAYLEAVTDTFLANAAGSGPFSAAYDSLMTVSTGGESLCLSGVVRSASTVVTDYFALAEAETEEERQAIASRMVHTLEDLVSDSELLLSVSADMAKDSLNDVGGMDLGAMYPGFENSDFLKNDLPVILELVEGIIDSGVLEALDAEGGYDASKVDMNQLSASLGTALNGSESLASLKSALIREVVEELTKELDPETVSGATQELLDAVANLPKTPLADEAAKKEGESLVLIMHGVIIGADGDKNVGAAAGNLLEGLARHPSIGVDKVVDAADDLLSSGGMKAPASVTAPLKDALRDAVSQPVGESSFSTLVDTAVDTVEALEKVANGETDAESMKEMITSNPEALLQIKDMVSEELLTEVGVGENADKVNSLLDDVFDAVAENKLDDAAATKEAESLSEALVIINDVAKSSDLTEQKLLDSADVLIEACLSSQILTDALAKITEGTISDPLGLFGSLRQDIRVTLSEKIDNHTTTENAIAAHNLKLFLGVA